MYAVELESERLYRYRPYRADELRLLLAGGQVRFSDPKFFNDPWDCRPLIRIPFLIDQEAENERWIGWLVDTNLKHGALSEKSAEEYRAKLRAERKLLHSEVKIASERAVKLVRSASKDVSGCCGLAGSGEASGGGGRNRTGVDGFAGRCMTTLPPRPGRSIRFSTRRATDQAKRESRIRSPGLSLEKLERETSLELATSTLARLRSTN
jgi:hypothetical protein